MTAAAATVSTVSESAPDSSWDARTVQGPGGNVLQGTCWAEHRRSQGARPRFVTFGDGHAALVVTRPARLVPGVLAVARKGPVAAGAAVEHIAEHARALAEVVRTEGAIELFVDPEIDRSDAYARAMNEAGFEVTSDVQPAIHVMRLRFPAGGSSAQAGGSNAQADRSADAPTDALFASFSKSTRQRVRGAERAGIVVRLDPSGERLSEFGGLLSARARDLGIALRPEVGHIPFIRRLLGADQARLYVAERDGELLGGLVAFAQGGRLSTAFSADRAELRHSLPGTMHLVRWTIIRDAFTAGMPSIDLGGVDAPGHREPPRPGDQTYGLFEHKASFGAVWTEREPARRVILRPWAERFTRTSRGVVRGTRSLGRRRNGAA